MLTGKELLNTDFIVNIQLHMKTMLCKFLLLISYRKDLKNLGRALERTIIIDNLAENFIHTTPENGIWVESWYDDMDDTVMEQLIPFLKEIVTSRVEDVRKLLTK